MKETYKYLSEHCEDKVEKCLRKSSGGYGPFYYETRIIHNDEEISLITFYEESLVDDLKYIETLDDFYSYYVKNKYDANIDFMIHCGWIEDE